MNGTALTRVGIWTLCFASATIALAFGTRAEGATVSIGSPTHAAFAPTAFGGQLQTRAQLLPAGASTSAGAPITGTLTSWRMMAASGTFTLRVLRPEAAGTYLASGSSLPQVFDGALVSAPAAIELRIRKGDLIGVDNSNGAIDQIGTRAGPGQMLAWTQPFPDGTSRVPDLIVGGNQIGVSADLRFCRVPGIVGMRVIDAIEKLRSAGCEQGRHKARVIAKRIRVCRQHTRKGVSRPDGFKVLFDKGTNRQCKKLRQRAKRKRRS